MNKYFKETNETVMAILSDNPPYDSNLNIGFAHYLTVQMDQVWQWREAIPQRTFNLLCGHAMDENKKVIEKAQSKNKIFRGQEIDNCVMTILLTNKQWTY